LTAEAAYRVGSAENPNAVNFPEKTDDSPHRKTADATHQRVLRG